MDVTTGYPVAERLGLVVAENGQRYADPYRWLEDPADERTVRWAAAQDELFAAARAGWADLERWRAELAGLAAVPRPSAPVIRGGRVFTVRREAGAEHPEIWVREAGAERVLVSPQEIDPAGGTVLEAWSVSAEGDLLACQLSRAGAEDSALWLLDVASGAVADGPIDRVRRTSIGWLPGGELFYYVRRLPGTLHPGEERYHRRVYLHRVGTDPDADVEVFGAGRDKTQFYTVAVTADGRWLTISATTGADPGTDIYLADLAGSPPQRPAFVTVTQGSGRRARMHIAPGSGRGDVAWLRTTRDAARGRIVACDLAGPGGRWRELIAERPGAVLESLGDSAGGAGTLGRTLGLVTWTRHAVAEITVHDLSDGRQVAVVPLPGSGAVSRITTRHGGGHDAWFLYADHATPPTVLHYDARTGDLAPWRAGPAGNGHRAVKTCQVSYESADGTVVRMFVISPEGRPDRPRPAILTGYGGFGRSMTPDYSPEALAWAMAGGVYAVACLRGGGEEGAAWHQAGRGAAKQNVFDDFDAAAGYLVRAGWTSAGRLAIMGNSNGGLLVGQAITAHPEKYAAAVCLAPLLDMARYELSGLGPSWRAEFGSAADPAGLAVLLSYSPYHHVAEGTAYPPVLLTAADGDTRVDPMHARKMCAALQHASTGGEVLLRMERGVGHGLRAASREVALQADCLAFAGAHVGLRPRGAA